MVTSSPTTAEELAASLRRASAARQSVAIRGAGTKSDWPRRTRTADLVVSTLGLNRVLAHQHGDLTATIEAGATLQGVNAALARHGQCLPIDPSFADTATIGGIVATNDAGPLRHRYGAPRDQVIGIQLVTGDGVIAKAGGQVVKNVAGYDLSKLVAGSFGRLAAIVSVTFKLSPLPRASATLVVSPRDGEHVGEIVREVMASQLEPIAFEIRAETAGITGGHRFSGAVILRFASVPRAVDAQVDATKALAPLRACPTTILAGDGEVRFWREHNDAIWQSPGAVFRASWLPANTARVLAAVEGCTTRTAGCDAALVGRAVVGAGLIRIDGDAESQTRAIAHVRASGVVGNIVVLRGSDDLKAACRVPDDQQRLVASLKQAFDPEGILL
jgi:glycolate oxidase FAD binding subunit